MSHPSAPYPHQDVPMPHPQDQYLNHATPPTRPNLLGSGASPVGAVFVHPKVDLDTGLHQPPPYGMKITPDGSQSTIPGVVTRTKSEAVTPKSVNITSSPSNLAAQPINYIPAVQVRYDTAERSSAESFAIFCFFIIFVIFGIAIFILVVTFSSSKQ
ncbi:hypothetical protein Ddc_11743 [Ditylenchus destructor]|nr:hypothetical protein Ddc_11743 [Ditylenchus destructor]